MKTNKIYLIATGALIFGLFLILVSLGMLGFNVNKLYVPTEYEEKEYTASSEINQIVMKEMSIDVDLIRSKDEEIHITYNDSNKDIYEITEQKNGTLAIKRKSLRQWYDYIMNIEIGSPILIVEIPEGYHGDLNIESADGTIHLYEITADNISIKTFDGKITLEEVTAKDSIYLKSTAGGIHLENVAYETKMECITRDGSLSGTLSGSALDYNITCKVMDGKSNLPTDNTQGKKSLTVDVIAGNAMLDFQE